MKQENFTAERVTAFKCQSGKQQSIFWDGKTPGLGLRVTAKNAKSYIFQTDLHGKTLRITIGDTRTWGVGAAQKVAARLKAMTDQGIDPRQLLADAIATKEAEAAALAIQESRETITISKAWGEYIEATKAAWGELHLRDHNRAMQAGGNKRTRSPKLTTPGALASLATVRLVDLTPELIKEWAKVEGAKRPARARNARTLLSTFLNWCAAHPTYKLIVTSNPAQNKDAKKLLGKAKAKNDALQYEQLTAWFTAVKKIGNPVISAYLQALLLTGARPNELTALKWEDIDFKWKTLTIRDKVEGLRVIPLTPYVAHLLATLPRRNLTVRQIGGETKESAPNIYVFSSNTALSGHLVEPRIAHDKACAEAGLDVTLHGLRRSFASLCEWVEMPSGIGAQIQGHKPQGVREQHYIRRPLDLLRMWHIKIEAWILEQAGIKFVPVQKGLRVVKA